MKQITIIFFVLVFVSCRSSQKLHQSTQVQKTATKEKLIDTIRIIARDTAIINALLECDSLGRVRIASLRTKDSEISRLQTSLTENKLSIKMETQTIERIKERILIDTVYIDNRIVDYKQIIVPIRWWKKVLMWIGAVFVALIFYKVIRYLR